MLFLAATLSVSSAAVGDAPLSFVWTESDAPEVLRQQFGDELRYYRSAEFEARVAERIGALAKAERDAPEPPVASLRMADLHAHVFSDLGFGGRVVSATTGACDGTDHGLRWGIARNLVKVAPAVFEDPMMSQLLRHCPRTGIPDFASWTHEQYSMGDLRTAHDGGLDVVVISAVNATILCAITQRHMGDVEGGTAEKRTHAGLGRDRPDVFDCGDDVNIHRQIAGILDYGGQHPTWFRVVTSPKGLLLAKQNQQLAVVIGIEGDDYLDGTDYGGIAPQDALDDCVAEARDASAARDEKRTAAAAGTKCAAVATTVVRKLWNLGVRVVIPIHEWDNALGGASVHLSSLFQPTTRIRDKLKRYDELTVAQLATRYVPFNGFGPFAGRFDRQRIWTFPMPLQEVVDPTDQRRYLANAHGFSAYGAAFVRALDAWNADRPEAPVVLDLAHFSDRTFAWLEAHEDAVLHTPLIVSHGVPRQLSMRDRAELEFPNSAAKYAFVAARGGTLALQTSNETLLSITRHPLTCPGSVESVDNGFEYLEQFTSRLAFGTDLNGGALGVAPSTGPLACNGGSVSPIDAAFGKAVACIDSWSNPSGNDVTFADTGLSSIAHLPKLHEAMRRGATFTEAVGRGADSFHSTWAGDRTSAPTGSIRGPTLAGAAASQRTERVSAAVLAACGIDAGVPADIAVDVQLRREPASVAWTVVPVTQTGQRVEAQTVRGVLGALPPQIQLPGGVALRYDANGEVVPLTAQERAALRTAVRSTPRDACRAE